MMRDIYLLASGPLFWLALACFAAGTAWKIHRFWTLSRQTDPSIHSGFRPGWAAASVARWIVPSGRTAAENFLTLLLVKAFHLCLLASLLLSAHVILIEEALGLGWWTFSPATANILVLVFLACAALLALRRLVLPHVRALTGRGDWLALGLTVTPVLTGYLASNQYLDYQALIALHALSGTALIAAMPFTKLSHTFMFFVSRAVTGSDFGKRGVGAW